MPANCFDISKVYKLSVLYYTRFNFNGTMQVKLLKCKF